MHQRTKRKIFDALLIVLVLIGLCQVRLVKAMPQVVWKATATGFFITYNGILVTAAHVVKNTRLNHLVVFNNELYEAKVIAIDKDHDLALLQIRANTPALGIERPRNGEVATDVGYPAPDLFDYKLIKWKGRVLLRNNSGYVDIEALSNSTIGCQGDSGAPIINKNGNAIGVFVDIRRNSPLPVMCSDKGDFEDSYYIQQLADKNNIQLTRGERNEDAVVLIYITQ